MNKNKHQEIDTKILDTSQILSLFIGFSFFMNSFYCFEHILSNMLIGTILISYGTFSIAKWQLKTKNKINIIRWTIVIIIIIVLPMQIYTFAKSNIIFNTKLFLLIFNICIDIFISLLFFVKSFRNR